jgi:hypothetical protein
VCPRQTPRSATPPQGGAAAPPCGRATSKRRGGRAPVSCTNRVAWEATHVRRGRWRGQLVPSLPVVLALSLEELFLLPGAERAEHGEVPSLLCVAKVQRVPRSRGGHQD